MVQTQAISEEELMQLSAMNPELWFERNADGSLVALPPRGCISATREAKAISRLMVWVEDNELGEVFSSSSGFRLPNGAVHSPSTAFIAKARLPEAWDQQQDGYIDLVLNAKSLSDLEINACRNRARTEDSDFSCRASECSGSRQALCF